MSQGDGQAYVTVGESMGGLKASPAAVSNRFERQVVATKMVFIFTCEMTALTIVRVG